MKATQSQYQHLHPNYRLWVFVIAALILLSGCQPPASTALPTTAVWKVQFTSSLDIIRPQINQCILVQPGYGVLVFDVPAADIDFNKSDITLVWGSPPVSSLSAYVIGYDEMVVIAHPDNPISTISLDQLHEIYGSGPQPWESLGIPLEGDIEIWRYSPAQDVEQIFNLLVGPAEVRNVFTGLAPNPAALRQAVAANPNAIGVLPRRWLDASVHEVAVSDLNPGQFRQPVVAVLPAPPTPSQQQWLECLQESLQ